MLGKYFGRISRGGHLLSLKIRGLVPDSSEEDPNEGQFAHFHDPDGNEVTIWEGKQ